MKLEIKNVFEFICRYLYFAYEVNITGCYFTCDFTDGCLRRPWNSTEIESKRKLILDEMNFKGFSKTCEKTPSRQVEFLKMQ